MGGSLPVIDTGRLRLEDRWLLAAVRGVLFEVNHAEAPSSKGVDWAFLKKQASLHALGPCLTRYCTERPQDVPTDFLAEMQREELHVRSYNFFLLQELGRLITHLQQKKLAVLAWKGPALAADVYPELGLRQCADIDLMVKPQEMEPAVVLMRELGYREMAVDTGGHTRNFQRESPRAIVELHRLVVQPHFSVGLDAESLLADVAKVSTVAGDIPVPAPEMMLLLLCIHGSKHVWERLSWISDVVLFLKIHPDLDWELLWRHAQRCRVKRMLSLGLLLAEGLIAGVVPENQLQKAEADTVTRKLADTAWGWMFLFEVSHEQALRRAWYQLRMRESFQDKLPLVKHLLQLVFIPTKADYAAIRLPKWLSFGYFLLRPLRLIAKALLPR